jgi:hypothetical protein
MVLIKNSPIRASQVKIGDMLGGNKVSQVKIVKRRGLYAPVTESGDIVVSGILASCYAAVLSHTSLNQHFGAHAFFSARRLVCAAKFEICENESYANGFPDWMPLSTIHFFMNTEQSHPVQVVATLALMPLITAAYMLEQAIRSPVFFVTLALVIVSILFKKKAKKYFIKSKSM